MQNNIKQQRQWRRDRHILLIRSSESESESRNELDQWLLFVALQMDKLGQSSKKLNYHEIILVTNIIK